MKDQLKERIYNFWKTKLQSVIKFSYYTIDFWVDPDSDDIVVIELNPVVSNLHISVR